MGIEKENYGVTKRGETGHKIYIDQWTGSQCFVFGLWCSDPKHYCTG